MAKHLFDLDKNQPQVMGILNVTPDSFSDGGHYFSDNHLSLDLCCARVEKMLQQGATIIDVGGESTRPDAAPVSAEEELQRVLPVIEMLQQFDVVVSLDSSSPLVMSEAAKLGVGLLNDVRALQREGALAVAATMQLPVCLMHMQGEPSTMQIKPSYANVVDEVNAFFQQRITACLAAGISKSNILLDPGFGFGKSVVHNTALLAGLDRFQQWGMPLLVGLSRKSMITQILGAREMPERVAASVALAVMAIERGAWIVRAHDIQETVDALKIASAILGETHE